MSTPPPYRNFVNRRCVPDFQHEKVVTLVLHEGHSDSQSKANPIKQTINDKRGNTLYGSWKRGEEYNHVTISTCISITHATCKKTSHNIAIGKETLH